MTLPVRLIIASSRALSPPLKKPATPLRLSACQTRLPVSSFFCSSVALS